MSRKIRGIEILYEDDWIIVIDKQSGIVVQDAGRGHSVWAALTDYVRKGQLKSRRQVYLVHRLDRDTSGVMMVAKDPATMDYFRTNWNRVTSKTYVALVAGGMEAPCGVFESFLLEDEKTLSVRSVPENTPGAKRAVSEWRVVERPSRAFGGTAVSGVIIKLKSGRKHQIRVHFAEAGHPVIGDTRYGKEYPAKRLMLHSAQLDFVHPQTGQTLSFQSPAPF